MNTPNVYSDTVRGQQERADISLIVYTESVDLSGKLSRRHIDIFFFFVARKFETICMKYQSLFSPKETMNWNIKPIFWENLDI